MNNKFPVKRLIICAAIAVAAIVLGYNNLFSYDYSMVFDSFFAAVSMTAIGEIFAALSRFPIVSYIISVIMCAVMFQIIVPFATFLVADYIDLRRVFSVYNYIVKLDLALYIIALIISIIFGVFVLHRKDVFNRQK
ncbi:MAG: hypothetical protein J1F04_04715 [Oscillospiraceae bacterium]|nr:hypothetical protein [Oscillospiraceae bacterium]